jgi:ABC-type lipoprotein release transport system permease subunit
MAAGFFNIVRDTSSFRGIEMRHDVALATLVMAITISLASSVFSLRKVLILDPATVFRS